MDLEMKLKEMIIEKSFGDIQIDDVAFGKDLVNDLGYNSIALILLVIEIEEEFEISLETEDINPNELSNYEYLYGVIVRLVKEKV